jgi:adenylate cyclase
MCFHKQPEHHKACILQILPRHPTVRQLGDIIVEGSDIYGDGVNVPARLEALSGPGGMCVSNAIYEQVRDRLKLPFEDIGEQQVKNIDRPVRVWH